MAGVYNKGKFILGSNILPTGITLKAMLMKSPFAYRVDDNTVADAIAGSAEISGTDYLRPILTTSWIEDDASDRVELKALEAEFGPVAVGETVTDCVVYEHVDGVAANDLLLCRIELANTPTNGQPFSVRFDGVDGAGAVLRLNDA